MELIQREPVTLTTVSSVGGNQCLLQILLYKYLFVLAQRAHPIATACFPVALFCLPSKSSPSLITVLSSPARHTWNFIGANSSTVPTTTTHKTRDPPCEVNTQASRTSLAPLLPSQRGFSLLDILPYFSLETRGEQAKTHGGPTWAGKFQSSHYWNKSSTAGWQVTCCPEGLL